MATSTWPWHPKNHYRKSIQSPVCGWHAHVLVSMHKTRGTGASPVVSHGRGAHATKMRRRGSGDGFFALGFGGFGHQGAFEVAHGLFQALFVFDQGDADVAFAVFAEGS